ncbi:hypothetical protein HK102_000770 [Quaeritorhiza haematococci]|nr:hypothetical protein HK102_000770 [Quaeritorhiza haematococci]
MKQVAICKEWKSKKTTNPLTGRRIARNKPTYKRLTAFCEKPGKHCKDALKDPRTNPLTQRPLLSETSKIAAFFKQVCEAETVAAKKNIAESKIKDKEVEHNYTSPLQCTLYQTVTLKDHQKHVCSFLQENRTKGMVLFHSVGSGKTITAITIIRCILQKNPKKRIFVLTPTSLVDNFHKELDKLGVTFGENVQVYSHGRFLNKIEKTGPNMCEGGVLVIDEAHNFKTRVTRNAGKNVRMLMRATAVASQVFMLTATPIQNNKSEFANLYAMISKKEHDLGAVYKMFEEGSDAQLLRALDNKISYFKNSDLSNYPSVTYHDITFYMTPKYYKMYMQIEQNESGKFKHLGAKDLSIFYNGIRQVVNYLDDKVTTPKIEWAIKHIQTSVQKKRKARIKWVEVKGSMTPLARKRAVNQYNSNEVGVIFVSTAGAEGLDLKGTRSVVIIEPHWNNEKIKQIVGRAVRYKSHEHLSPKDRHVDVYHLILKKPKERRADKLASAGEFLMDMSAEKEKHINEFYDVLIKASI